ncbi:MAG: hypothetical protein OXQ84_00945 [bacterium]|nr:hypothetical protein [bacterium]
MSRASSPPRSRVEEEEGPLSEMIVELRRRLMDLLPEFGAHLGCDGTVVPSKSTGTASDRDADRDRHETKGVTVKARP